MTCEEYDAYMQEYDAADDGGSRYSNIGDKFDLLNRFRERGLGNVSNALSTCWFLYWSFCDCQGKVTLSDETAAKYLNRTTDATRKVRRQLMKAGYLVRTGGGFHGSASTYVLFACPIGIADPKQPSAKGRNTKGKREGGTPRPLKGGPELPPSKYL